MTQDNEPSAGLVANLRSAANLLRQSLRAVPGTAHWADSEQSKACDEAAGIIERAAAAELTDDAKDAAPAEGELIYQSMCGEFGGHWEDRSEDGAKQDFERYRIGYRIVRLVAEVRAPDDDEEAQDKPQEKKAMTNLENEPPWRATYRVKIRRGPDFEVKPEAEQIDGKGWEFTRGWRIEDEERYPGEWAMIPSRGQGWPDDAPGWVATGDLVELEARSDHGQG